MSSAEERLARLEVLVGELRDDIKEERVKNSAELGLLKADVRELVKAAHMGRGVLWIMLPVGTVIGWIVSHAIDWFQIRPHP